MGDDSEADHVVYQLYHQFTSGALDTESLLEELDALGVTSFFRTRVEALAPAVEAQIGSSRPVVAIYINETGVSESPFAVEDHSVEGLTRYHAGAWPLSLDLFEEGFITADSVEAVKEVLGELGQGEEDLDAAAASAVDREFLSQETVDAF